MFPTENMKTPFTKEQEDELNNLPLSEQKALLQRLLRAHVDAQAGLYVIDLDENTETQIADVDQQRFPIDGFHNAKAGIECS